MILNLDDNWFLDCDATNVVLTERRVITAKAEGAKGIAPKPENIGKTRDVQHGFYGNITQACQGYLSKGIVSMDGMLTATQLIAAWNEAAERVEKACKDIPKRGHDPLTPYQQGAVAAALMKPPSVMIQTPDGPLTLPQKSPEPLYDLPQA